MSEPTAEEARHDLLTDKIIAMIDADPTPEAACRSVMAGLAGMIVTELGPSEAVSWLYRFADEVVELEARPDAWSPNEGKAS